MAGFGRSPFGRGPFGRSNTGSDLLIRSFPSEYFDPTIQLDADETVKDNDKDPLLIILRVMAEMVQRRRVDVERIETLIDYETAPLDIVRLHGDMLGLGIDKNDPEFLQRSFLGNASQWLQLKGSRRGYEVRGLASGFTVAVENFWRIDEMYIPFIPLGRLKYLKPPKADPDAVAILHTDAYPGEFAGTPTEEDITYRKSSYIRVVFEVAEPRRAGVNYNQLLDLVIDKIKDVVAIHHELYKVIFQIRMFIDEPITVDMLIEEFSIFNFMVQGIYDIEAADVHPTDDGHLTVDFVLSSGESQSLEVDASSFGVSMEINEYGDFGMAPESSVDMSIIVGP